MLFSCNPGHAVLYYGRFAAARPKRGREKAMMNEYKNCFELLNCSRKTVVLTGAGISTLSGISDFRGANGFYTKKSQLYGVSREQLFDIDFFRRRPEVFYQYAREYLYPMLDKVPSIAHAALAAMQKKKLCTTIFTQNIDTLHSKAGATDCVELHGSLREHFCINCGKTFSTAAIRARAEKEAVPRCGECSGLIKPRVVFFGESLDQDDLERAFRECAECDVLLVLGSSLTVTPVANLPMTSVSAGGQVVIVNAQPTPIDKYAAFKFDDIAQFCTEMARFFNLDLQQ